MAGHVAQKNVVILVEITSFSQKYVQQPVQQVFQDIRPWLPIIRMSRRSTSVLPKGRNDISDFSEVAATRFRRDQTQVPTGSGEMFVEHWAGSMFCVIHFIFLKASFMATKRKKRKSSLKMTNQFRLWNWSLICSASTKTDWHSCPQPPQPVQVFFGGFTGWWNNQK